MKFTVECSFDIECADAEEAMDAAEELFTPHTSGTAKPVITDFTVDSVNELF